MGIKKLIVSALIMAVVLYAAESFACDIQEKYILCHQESAKFAEKITRDAGSELEKYEIITWYISENINYDYIRAIKLPKTGGGPDLDYVWDNKRGVCIDIAALTVWMLRAVGIEALLCIGTVRGYPHAWVETEIDGEVYIYDHENRQEEEYNTVMRF